MKKYIPEQALYLLLQSVCSYELFSLDSKVLVLLVSSTTLAFTFFLPPLLHDYPKHKGRNLIKKSHVELCIPRSLYKMSSCGSRYLFRSAAG